MSVDAVTNGVAQPSMDAANVAAPIPAPAPASAPASAPAPAPAPSVTPASTAAHEATAINAPAEAPKFSWLYGKNQCLYFTTWHHYTDTMQETAPHLRHNPRRARRAAVWPPKRFPLLPLRILPQILCREPTARYR